MKCATIILTAAAAISFLAAGCKSTPKKKIADDEMKLLRSKQDVVISGKTGEIVGTKADKNPKKVVCKECGFPKGSLRQRMIISEEVQWDDETLQKLKDKKNLTLSGRTGAIVGTKKDKNPSKVKCKDCGFPKGSLRQRVIIMEEL